MSLHRFLQRTRLSSSVFQPRILTRPLSCVAASFYPRTLSRKFSAASFSAQDSEDAELDELQDQELRMREDAWRLLEPVVKVYSVISHCDYRQPWQNKQQKEMSGSGFVLSGRRILTNAHVVAGQKIVMVRRYGFAEKFIAQVACTGHECDIAMLEVDDERFWKDMPHLELEDDGDEFLPELDEPISVVGYPQGGDNISVTRGVVSRVEPQRYAHSGAELLAIQIDAAINPGNSGGPAIRKGRVAGIAFQNLSGAENIGFIIPAPVVHHFLLDHSRHGKYVGFCSVGVILQNMENPYLRKFYQIPDDPTASFGSGVLVKKVEPLSPAQGILQEHDILLAIDGHLISNDGTISFRTRERIPFRYLVMKKFAGDTCSFKILRSGRLLDLTVPVHLRSERELVPSVEEDALASYFIFGGLVFVPVSFHYLEEWGEDWYNSAPRDLVRAAVYDFKQSPDEQIVVVSQVLASAVNVGYERLTNLRILKVDGNSVKNLAHLADLISKSREQFVRIELEHDSEIVMDRMECLEKGVDILKQHRVPADRSPDLQRTLQYAL